MEYAAIQALINSGMAWKLEGAIGRACMQAMQEGFCMLGTEGYRDYYGNYVPSRYQVQEGTKGSFDYVERLQGMEQAQAMADVGNEPPTIDEILGA